MIKKVFPILALSMFSSTLGIGIVMPLLPIYISEMGASGIWLGVIVSSYAISNSITVPIAGRLSDIKGRKLFLAIGLIAYSLISLGYIFATDVVMLALVRFVHGIAGSMTIPVGIAYLGDLSPENEEGKWKHQIRKLLIAKTLNAQDQSTRDTLLIIFPALSNLLPLLRVIYSSVHSPVSRNHYR